MAVRSLTDEGRVLVDWRPEDEGFWSQRGEAIAWQRGLADVELV